MYCKLFQVKHLYHSNLTYMEILYEVLTLYPNLVLGWKKISVE